MSHGASHADLALRLADYARGSLDAAARAEVAAHLAECDECRGMLEAYALLAAASAGAADRPGGAEREGAMSPKFATGPHLTSAAIAALAVDERGAGPAPDEARHLDACRACSQDLSLARAANDDGAGARVPTARFGATRSLDARSAATSRWLLPLAAAFAVGLLGLATLAALRHSSTLSGHVAALENDNAALRTQVADLSRAVAESSAAEERSAAPNGAGGEAPGEEGAIPYLLLHATVRGAGGVERLNLRPGASSVYVALMMEVPATARRPGEGGRAVLSDAAGREVWAAPLLGAAMDALTARGDALLLRIPAAVLSGGRMEVRVTPDTPAGGKRIWFRSEIEVSAPAPSR